MIMCSNHTIMIKYLHAAFCADTTRTTKFVDEAISLNSTQILGDQPTQVCGI
tara:strand:+ start:620 stop:775 length:156 start_codon:yes stop_codon:yes gene_type:complete